MSVTIPKHWNGVLFGFAGVTVKDLEVKRMLNTGVPYKAEAENTRHTEEELVFHRGREREVMWPLRGLKSPYSRGGRRKSCPCPRLSGASGSCLHLDDGSKKLILNLVLPSCERRHVCCFKQPRWCATVTAPDCLHVFMDHYISVLKMLGRYVGCSCFSYHETCLFFWIVQVYL